MLLWPVIRSRLGGFNSASGLPVSWVDRLYNLRTYFWPVLFSDNNWILGVRPAARIARREQAVRLRMDRERLYLAALGRRHSPAGQLHRLRRRGAQEGLGLHAACRRRRHRRHRGDGGHVRAGCPHGLRSAPHIPGLRRRALPDSGACPEASKPAGARRRRESAHRYGAQPHSELESAGMKPDECAGHQLLHNTIGGWQK